MSRHGTSETDETRYRLLIDAITDYAIYMLDPDGVVSSWNPGAQRFKGYTAEEIVGQHFSVFYLPEERALGVPQFGLETARREGRWEQEGRRLRKNGEAFWAHVIIDAIRNEAGEVIGFAKVTRDISERVASQRALEEAREALFQSQKLDAIGQLTGGVAHDFNNLLMAILGSLELVRKRLPDDPRITPLVDNAIHGAERGANLTRRMLAFARKQELALQSVDLSMLIEGMLSFMQRTLGPRIHITTDISAILPPVLTDANQLENAILNLAVNARDAMGGEGDITLIADVPTPEQVAVFKLPPGDYVRLAMTDAGEGMDPDTLARAADPFFTTKGVGKGTGLGLSMVHGLASQSGGRMVIYSRPSEGARVELWLPAASATDPVYLRTLTEAPAPSPCALRVLAVDDDSLVLINTAALLEDMGHSVIHAESGEAALEALQNASGIDLVITDQAMPGMTGLQLRDRIAALRPGLPVILATGYAEMPAGADGPIRRLAKPFTQAELAVAVTAAMEEAERV